MGKGKGKKGRNREKNRPAHPPPRQAMRAATGPRAFKDEMGIFQEYLNLRLAGPALDQARVQQLARIGTLRKSAILSYATRIGQLPPNVDNLVTYDDLLPFTDALDSLTGDRVTMVLETPGGFGEVGRDMVEMLHERFKHVTFLVPGMAKSTGTIMCLGGHEILMGPGSSLGPIDAQLSQEGKRFSAEAFLEGFNAIKDTVDKTGKLNAAYIPILQRISPGELQNAHNALEFARATVTDWLTEYKFANWKKLGVPVSQEKRKERAREIAEELAKQSKWFSHGRSLRIPDLEKLGLKIEDFSKNAELNDAVLRYQVLLRMTFEAGPVYKIFETPTSSLNKRFNVAAPQQQPAAPPPIPADADTVAAEVACPACRRQVTVQVDFTPGQSLTPGAVRIPASGTISCPHCKAMVDFTPLRVDIEKQVGRKALTPQPGS